MNILMLAPEPFFEPRGTPISVYFRIQALGELGHRVTLITYPIGKNVSLRNLTVRRPPNFLALRKIKIGPSLLKLPLDLLLLLKSIQEMLRQSYDLIFSHEEAALLGVWLAKAWKKPHVYDMHSCLPQQLENFEFTRSRFLISLFRRMEDYVLRNSHAVIVICRDLLETVASLGYGGKATLIENVLDFPAQPFTADKVGQARREYAPRGEKLVLYAGNFEPYQGIPLLLRAAHKIGAGVRFVLVGGTGRSLTEMKELARSLGISEKVVFVGKVPPARVPFFVELADVLVSPRLSGTNTPLKIYSFLKSGKPLVATNLWTHTQVLSPQHAVLANPDPDSLAGAIVFALGSEEAREWARAAKEMADREYTAPKYYEKIGRVLELARHNFNA
ncbi:MAG: glycosyltransferase family 4 protein [Acidobacteriota bacterium]